MAKGKYEYWLTPEGLLRLEAWARDGLTDEPISQNIGIHRDMLVDWKKRYSDISDPLKRGGEIVDVTCPFRGMVGARQNKTVMLKYPGWTGDQ